MDSGDGGGQVTLRDGEVTYSFSQVSIYQSIYLYYLSIYLGGVWKTTPATRREWDKAPVGHTGQTTILVKQGWQHL